MMRTCRLASLSALLIFSFTTPVSAEQTTLTIPALSPVEYYAPSNESLEFLTGQFSPAKHPNFVRLGSNYSSRSNMYLQKEAYEAFKAMYKAAKKDGVRLVIRSAARNFNTQRTIWEGKWNGKRKVGGVLNIDKKIPDPVKRALKILEYSSMPGSSRHHWGTEIDLNSFDNKWFTSGKGKKLYQWLEQNAARFGYCQPYTAKGPDGRGSGYNEERWHWSYTPLAGPYTEQAAQQLRSDMIRGFKGGKTAESVKIVEHYVLGINPACRIAP
ncbi:MAG: M15 family metallopeptidase [Thiolinea sp.]